MRCQRLLAVSSAAMLVALALGGSPSPVGATTDAVSSVVPVLDSTAQRMVALASDGVRILQSERAAAPNGNGSTKFPARTNAAASKLSFRASPTVVRSSMGVPLAAIGNWMVTGSASLKRAAIADINILLESQTQPNGALFNTPGSADIDTMFFACHLGMAAVLLGSALPASDRETWTSAVTGAADYLVANRNLPRWDPDHSRWLPGWYTNGNIVIGNTLVEALAYKLTGMAQYKANYERALEFSVSPPQARWPGYGFMTVVSPTRADGSDGRGYFTEAGSKPGFDPDYTMLQADQLARLFQVTRDTRVLRLLNMVTNQLLSRTNTKTWNMDGSNGTRHNYASEVLDTAAIATLAYQGGRADLMRYVEAQGEVIDREFRQVLKQQVPLGDRFMYVLGTIPVTIISSELDRNTSPVRSPAPSPVATKLSVTKVTPVVTHGDRVDVSGALTRADTKRGVAGQLIYLQYRHHGSSSFSTYGTAARTNAAGAVSFGLFRPGYDVDVRLTSPAGSGYAAVTSASQLALVRRKVTLTTTTPIVRAGHRLSVTGTLSPAGARNPVQLQRWTGRIWTTVSRTKTSSAKYRFTIVVKSRGTHTYRVYVEGDAFNATSTSNTRRVRVT